MQHSILKYGIQIEKRKKLKVPATEELDRLMRDLKDYNKKYRRTKKEKNALYHDAMLYYNTKLIDNQILLTDDNSLIRYGYEKKEKGQYPYSMKILVFLQTVSSLITDTHMKTEFDDLFTEIIHKDFIFDEKILTDKELKFLSTLDINATKADEMEIKVALSKLSERYNLDTMSDDERKEMALELNSILVSTDITEPAKQRREERKLHNMEEKLLEKENENKLLKKELLKFQETEDSTIIEDGFPIWKVISGFVIVIFTILLWSSALIINYTSYSIINNEFFFILTFQIIGLSIFIEYLDVGKRWVKLIIGGFIAAILFVFNFFI